MKKVLFLILVVTVAVACNKPATNRVEGTDAQSVADGSGEKLTVDTQASSIRWVGSKVGGAHNGTIALKAGKLAVAGEELVSGEFVIDMNGIVDEDLTDSTYNQMLVDHLKSADFFDVATYPESTFAVTKVEAVTSDTITHLVSGNLKLKDVEKNITFGANITKDGDVYKAVTLPFSIDRTQWNVKYGSKTLFANLKDNIVDDNIQLQITIVAEPVQ